TWTVTGAENAKFWSRACSGTVRRGAPGELWWVGVGGGGGSGGARAEARHGVVVLDRDAGGGGHRRAVAEVPEVGEGVARVGVTAPAGVERDVEGQRPAQGGGRGHRRRRVVSADPVRDPPDLVAAH